MKNSTKIARQLIVLALATILFSSAIALYASAVRPPLKEETRATTNLANNIAGARPNIASSPVPTPTPGPADEAQLAYTKLDLTTFHNDIFRQRADGAELLNLTNSLADESIFVWSPDGSKLTFLRLDFLNSIASSYVMAADGSNVVQLTNVPGEYISAIIWSPDSSKLLFSAFPYNGTADGQIYLINADGTGRTNVSGTDGFNTAPAWSPDGTKISFMRGHSFPDPTPSTNDLYVANADGTNPIQVAHAAGERDFGPVWSPDGTRLAFTRIFPDNTFQVYTVRPDGSDTLRIVNDPGVWTSSRPQWSPDGRLSFETNQITGLAIEAANFDGSGRVVIYSPPQGGLPYAVGDWTWSPDGTRLALPYSIGEGQGANVCVVNADGSGLHCIGSSDQEFNTSPDWSPDGARLAFITNVNGFVNNSDIDIVNADGTNRVDLTNAPALYGAPKWRPRPALNTPAGTNVVVTVGGVQLTFSNVTQAGQTTVTPIDPATAGTLPGGYGLTSGSLAFQITTTAIYSGPIVVCMIDSSVNDPAAFDILRILHGEGGVLVDRTILPPDAPAPNFASRTICARVNSLSPFVIATRSYGINVLFDQTKAVKSGSTLPVKLQLTNASGANVSSSSIVVTALSVLRISTDTSGAVQDSGNANPDNNFRFSGGAYIFNLSTKGYVTGTYLLRFKAGSDPIIHTVQFQVK